MYDGQAPVHGFLGQQGEFNVYRGDYGFCQKSKIVQEYEIFSVLEMEIRVVILDVPKGN